LAVSVAVTLGVAACGGDTTGAPLTTRAPVATGAPVTPTPSSSATTRPATTALPAPSTSSPPTSADTGWIDVVAAGCRQDGEKVSKIRDNDGTPAGITAQAQATMEVVAGDPFASLVVPAAVQPTLDHVTTMGREAVTWLDTAIARAGAGDTKAAQRALDEGFDRLTRIATAWAIAGAPCGLSDPARAKNASLTVPLEMDSWQLNAGFGSIWVSERLADRVMRIDPTTGEVQATVDVGDAPFKLQAADGRMWVRTASSYVAIDPATNAATATLAKADVGPSANRSWAVDGAMWICDGRRLHRYDPKTVTLVATIDLEIDDCGAVYATPDLAVVWTYNEDAGQSGTSAAAFVDPKTNAVLATVPLPVDVGGPVLLPDSLFFAGYQGSTGVVVDRATWTVKATPDLGVPGGGTGQSVADGTSIYVVTEDEQDVLRVDSTTFAVTDTIRPLGANAIVIDDGALWVARGQPVDIAQRFDLGGGR
jgi:hypothetical protein